MPEFESGVNNEHIAAFLKKGGQKAARILSILGKQKQFYNTIMTPIGQELLREVLFLMEEKLDLIINEKSSEADRAEYRVLKKIALSWSEKISGYLKNIETIKNAE